MVMKHGSHENQVGLLIDKKISRSGRLLDVLLNSGKIISGVPERYVEAISKELTNEQLEQVRGGMCPQRFSNWRAEKLNEGR